eukprot:1023382_1
MLGFSKVAIKQHCLHVHSNRFATVVVGGSAKNHGSGALPRKRRGPKVTGNELVNAGAILVKQRWWLERDKLWYGGFNVYRGKKGILNALVKGRVLYYYDTNEKKKYVSVVPEEEDPRDYMRPYYTPREIYQMAKSRAVRRVRLDCSVNVNKKNKEMNELRNTQLNYINQIEHIPIELICNHETDHRFRKHSFSQLCEQTEKLNNVKPVFEKEQIKYAINNKLQFEMDEEQRAQIKEQNKTN